MIIKEFLEKFLQEAKPVGDNNKEIWLDYLKDKYSDKSTTGLFVSFVQVDKIGINPYSTYNTPNGVYTYPMRFLLDGNNVPYRGSKKPNKIKVLKAVSNNVLDNNLSKEEYEKCKEQLLKVLEEKYKDKPAFLDQFNSYEKYIELIESDTKIKTNFGKLWNVTRRISSNPNNWSKLLIDLGFDIVYDNGNGIIHNNEPIQAVFLNPKSYKVVDEEFVDTEARYDTTHKIMTFKSLKDEIHALGDTKRAYTFLKTNKKKIMHIESSSGYNLTDLMVSVIYNWFGFTEEEKTELLNFYKELFKNTFKYKHSIHILDRLDKDDKLHFCKNFHEEISKIVYEFLSKDDDSIYETLPKRFLERYFPEIIEKLPKTQEESLEIEELLKSIQESIDEKKFKKIVENNKKKIAKDPNEFFLDLPSTPMKATKNNSKTSFDN